MAITKSLVKRMSDPNSVRPDQHKQHPSVTKLLKEEVVNKIETNVPVNGNQISEIKGIYIDSTESIDNKLIEILDAIKVLNDKYEGIKDNMELILSDLDELSMQVVEIKKEKPNFIQRLFKWQLQ